MRRELLAQLCEAAGTSGWEDRIRAIVRPHLTAACDRVESDPLGGLIGRRDADGPTLMLAAHMDEIGLMVTHVDDRGFVWFVPTGGWDARTLVGQRVSVHGREDVAGIVGTTPVHLLDEAARNRAPRIEELAIDTGLSADAVRTLVRPGDRVTRTRTFQDLGELVTGKVGLRGARVATAPWRPPSPSPSTPAPPTTAPEPRRPAPRHGSDAASRSV